MKLTARQYIAKINRIVNDLTDKNADKSMDEVFSIVHDHPEVKKYEPKGSVPECQLFPLNYNIQSLAQYATDHNYQSDLQDVKENGKQDFFSRMGRSALRLDKQGEKVLANAKKHGHEYLQNACTIRSTGRSDPLADTLAEPLTAKYARDFIQSQADNAFLYLMQNSKVENPTLNSKEAVIYCDYIVSGLNDLKSELYREDHNTIPASHNYDSIENKIRRDVRRYLKIQNVLRKHPKATVRAKTLAPNGFVSSIGGNYQTMYKPEMDKIINAIVGEPNVKQTSLL